MNEIIELIMLLKEAGMIYTIRHPSYDLNGWQIVLWKDKEYGTRLDDAVWAKGSCGYEEGLLECCVLNDCRGYLTGEQVFEGWCKLFYKKWLTKAN